METLLHFFDRMSNFTSNLRLKFWWWALETIFHRFYSEGFENKIFTRHNKKWWVTIINIKIKRKVRERNKMLFYMYLKKY